VDLDVTGHYVRPNVFEFTVCAEPRPLLRHGREASVDEGVR
jgi:hypothetical protein